MPVPAAPYGRVSLRDVARAVGVSHVAVSMALRGVPRISAARRAEIEAAAARLGYRPDPMLASLASYRRARGPVPAGVTVGWINQWPDPRALRRLHEFDLYWRGASHAAGQMGFRLEEFVVGPGLTAARLQEILLARGVQGLLLPPHPEALRLDGFDWDRHTIVRLGISLPLPRVDAVVSDQADAASLAFGRIHALGYRRIGFVSSPRFDRNTRGNFRAGYLRSAEDLASPRRRVPVLLLEERVDAAAASALRAWLRRARPDAVITTLPHLKGLLQRLGVEVPRDLAVAATSVLDGNFSAGIDQHCREIGAVAMRTLAALMHQNQRGIPEHARRILVGARWVDGPSLPAATGVLRPLPV